MARMDRCGDNRVGMRGTKENERKDGMFNFEVTGFGKRMKYCREDTEVHRLYFTLGTETEKRSILSE